MVRKSSERLGHYVKQNKPWKENYGVESENVKFIKQRVYGS